MHEVSSTKTIILCHYDGVPGRSLEDTRGARGARGARGVRGARGARDARGEQVWDRCYTQCEAVMYVTGLSETMFRSHFKMNDHLRIEKVPLKQFYLTWRFKNTFRITSILNC